MANPISRFSLVKRAVYAVSPAPQAKREGDGGNPLRETPAFFSLRTTIAALMALTVANALGMEHPWWAAMTVWLVAQPTQGLLLERVIARLAGSAVGAAAGAAILFGLAGQPVPSLFVLALWLMLCAGIGSMFRYFRNYGFVLAGYTAAIIVLSGLADGVYDGRLAGERVICTMLGAICSALASIYGVPMRRSEHLAGHVDELLQRCLDRVEQCIRYGSTSSPSLDLVAAVASLERNVDKDAGGSLRERLKVLRLRRISGLLLELIALTPQEGNARDAMIPASTSSQDRVSELSRLCRDLIGSQLLPAQPNVVPLASVLNELSAMLRQTAAIYPERLHRRYDLLPALQAALRPATALMLAIAFWWFSGWHAGPTMAMTAALFAALFSANKRGNEALIHVLVGSSLGAIAGTLVYVFLLPQAENFWAIQVYVAPFLAVGAGLMQRPSTAKMAIDMNMIFLLTAQPGSHYAGAAYALNQSAAIIMGVLAAVATYWLLLPVTPEVNRRRLVQRIVTSANTVNEAQALTVAIAAHRLLRAALTSLLDVCNPADRIFVLAQDCLVRSRFLLVQKGCCNGLNSTIAASVLTASEALHRSVAELSVYVTSPSTNDRSFL